MIDELAAEIQQAKARYREAQQAQLEVVRKYQALTDLAEREVKVLERAAALRAPHEPSGPALLVAAPPVPVPEAVVKKRTSKGRIFGAVTFLWRQVYEWMLDRYPHGASDAQVAILAVEAGRTSCTPKEARRQLETHCRLYKSVAEFEGGWRVTPTGSKRFCKGRPVTTFLEMTA